MFKVSFEAPKFGVAEEVKDLLRGKRTKKDQRQLWTHKERVVVVVLIALTFLFISYFWYKGQGKLPALDLGGFGLNQKVILEK